MRGWMIRTWLVLSILFWCYKELRCCGWMRGLEYNHVIFHCSSLNFIVSKTFKAQHQMKQSPMNNKTCSSCGSGRSNGNAISVMTISECPMLLFDSLILHTLKFLLSLKYNLVMMCSFSAAFAAMSAALLFIMIVNGGMMSREGDDNPFQVGSVLPERLHQVDGLQHDDTSAKAIAPKIKSSIGIDKEDQGKALLLPNRQLKSTLESAKGPFVTNIGDTTKVSTINLIGERHSGTNWITDHLRDCFGDQIEVSLINILLFFSPSRP